MAEVLAALARGELVQSAPLGRAPARRDGLHGADARLPRRRRRRCYSLKAVCIAPEQPGARARRHQGFVALFDGETGELRAFVNASAITAIRTAAVSAVATRLLARPESRDARDPRRRRPGAGAPRGDARRAAVRARARLEPRRRRTRGRRRRTASRSAAAEEALRRRGRRRHRDDVARADRAPRVAEAEGAHVNAVGSSIKTTRELDTATMARGRALRRPPRVDGERVRATTCSRSPRARSAPSTSAPSSARC